MSAATRYRELLGIRDGKRLTGSDVHRALSGARKVTKRLAMLARGKWNKKKEEAA